MGGFYKIFHEFEPNRDWLNLEIKNGILVKVDGEVNTELRYRNQYKKYTNAAFTIRDGQIIATIDMNVGHRNVARDVFIERVISVFPFLNRSMITQIDEQSNVGIVAFPYQTILVPVWSELTMNNIFFSRIFAVNESIRASKVRVNAYLYVINSKDDIVCITLKETDKANMYGNGR
jgi:hypothetical protein